MGSHLIKVTIYVSIISHHANILLEQLFPVGESEDQNYTPVQIVV